jgi:uncharacterized membrane-anchored protein YhcB (DUF1043 family)
MDLVNWLELAALLLGITAGLILWRVCRAKLKREGGVEGIVIERGKPARRRQLDIEEEIKQLKSVLGKK